LERVLVLFQKNFLELFVVICWCYTKKKKSRRHLILGLKVIKDKILAKNSFEAAFFLQPLFSQIDLFLISKIHFILSIKLYLSKTKFSVLALI